jgi:DNA repair protein RecO (recombination protein O)
MTSSAEQFGWVLHRRPWRESSLLIEFFSGNQGRIGLVAKGARSARSPWRGLAEPFCPLTASWTRRGEMGTLTELESAGNRLSLLGRALWCGLYANELIFKLLVRDDPAPELFQAYAELLTDLASNQALAPALRRFELSLLGFLGVAPDFEHDALERQCIRPDGLYHLDPEAGFIPAKRPGPTTYPGDAVLALAGGVRDDHGRGPEARQIMRRLIDHQLDGRRLESRRLFENLTHGTEG